MLFAYIALLDVKFQHCCGMGVGGVKEQLAEVGKDKEAKEAYYDIKVSRCYIKFDMYKERGNRLCQHQIMGRSTT